MPAGWGPLPKMRNHISLETPDVAGVHPVLEQIARQKLVCVLSVCCIPESLTPSGIPGPGTRFLASRQERRNPKLSNVLAVQNMPTALVHLSGMRTEGRTYLTS